MNFSDLYALKPQQRVEKSAPTPWDGEEGKEARSRGVRTAEEFAVFKVISDAHSANKSGGEYLSDDAIARRLKASPNAVGKIVQALLLRGVVRADAGILGVRRLVPAHAG